MKKIISILLVLVMVFAISGCAKQQPDEITITYVKTPLNIPSIVEKVNGTFEKDISPTKINWNEIATGPDQTKALASGDLQIAHAIGATTALIAAGAGMDLKIVGIYSRSPKSFMLVTKNESITKVSDLKGKKIAGAKGSVLHELLVAALKKEGMSISDVEFINMTAQDAAAALQAGSIDVAMLAGAAGTKAISSGAKMIINGEGYVDGTIVIATTKEFYNNNKDLVEKFIDSHAKTVEYVNNNKEECFKIASDELGIPVSAVENMFGWYDFNTEITEKDIESLNKTQDFLIENQMQKNKVDINDLIK